MCQTAGMRTSKILTSAKRILGYALTRNVQRIGKVALRPVFLMVSPPKTRNSIRTLAIPQQAVDLLIAEQKSTLATRICSRRPRPGLCMTRTPSDGRMTNFEGHRCGTHYSIFATLNLSKLLRKRSILESQSASTSIISSQSRPLSMMCSATSSFKWSTTSSFFSTSR